MVSFLSSPLLLQNPISHFAPKITLPNPRRTVTPVMTLAMATQQDSDSSFQNSTKLVTFLGKGGSGKTTSAVFAAQHYAMEGLSTCLVIHTQDPTAEHLLNCKIGSSPVVCNNNLSALRFETTKMLLEPLNRLKQADSRLNMTQGVLERIVGEELGVLPGMDPIFSTCALEKLLGFFRKVAEKNHNKDKFDIIVYDGSSSDEILRMISAASKGRLYLRYLRNLAEKTDLGRLAGPSLIRLIDEAMNTSGSTSLNGKMSAEVWDALERMLEKGSSAFTEPQKFKCFLVMDPKSPISVSSALRYWGCTIQAGACVSGTLGVTSAHLNTESVESVKESFSPLPFAFIPRLSIGCSILDWNTIIKTTVNEGVRNVLSMHASGNTSSKLSPVKFDSAKKSVTLLMPGFDKSDIKLYQYRGGSELLVEAGDQRRVIQLPSEIQGKVGGAKFIDRSLVITMR